MMRNNFAPLQSWLCKEVHLLIGLNYHCTGIGEDTETEDNRENTGKPSVYVENIENTVEMEHDY